MNSTKTYKLLFSLGIALLFIALGCYLIKKDDNISVTIGYANIIFFSIILLLSFAKLFQQLISKKSKQ